MPESGREERRAEGADATVNAHLLSVLESVLFASGDPLSLRRLAEILMGPSPAEIRKALERLGEACAAADRGVRLVQVAGGYQLRTARENADWVRAVFRDKPRRLGRAALETLSIIAYRQPVTRAEVEAIRGVDVDAVLNTLLQRDLIKVCGRKETVGRPLLYVTTATFLELFGLRDLTELPVLKEVAAAPELEGDGQTQGEVGGTATAVTGDATADSSAPAGDAAPETPEPSGNSVATKGGGDDPGGPGASEWTDRDGPGDEGRPEPRSD